MKRGANKVSGPVGGPSGGSEILKYRRDMENKVERDRKMDACAHARFNAAQHCICPDCGMIGHFVKLALAAKAQEGAQA